MKSKCLAIHQSQVSLVVFSCNHTTFRKPHGINRSVEFPLFACQIELDNSKLCQFMSCYECAKTTLIFLKGVDKPVCQQEIQCARNSRHHRLLLVGAWPM